MTNSGFSSYHPAVNFLFFAAVLLFSMFFLHPVFFGISFVCSLAYAVRLNGVRAVKFSLLGLLPMMLLVALINPAFNHDGVTVLVYVNDNPITLEAVCYGLAAAVMFASVLLWFSCYNAVMTSDKFLSLFGRVIPALSMLLSMCLRFVPRFKAQARVIAQAQRCVGRDPGAGSLLRRAKNGMQILSILTTWALENAVDTADSMKARGYGLKGRTSFSLYRFDRRDTAAFLGLLSLLVLVFAGAALGENSMQYFPRLVQKEVTGLSAVIYAGYALLCLTPLILDGKEALKWRRLLSKT